MDIKEEITKLAERIQKDEALQAQFKSNPIKAVEELIGIALPDDLIEKIADGVKARLSAEQISGALGALKKFF